MQIIALAVTALLTLGSGGGKVKWIRDFERGIQQAKMGGGAAMLYFSADW